MEKLIINGIDHANTVGTERINAHDLKEISLFTGEAPARSLGRV